MPVAGGKHTFGFSASSGGWCAAPCGRSSEVAAALLLCSPVVLCLPNSASRSCRMLWWRGGGSCSPGCLHSGGVLGCCRAVGGVGLPGCCMKTVASVRGLVAGVAAATARCGLCLGPLRRGGPRAGRAACTAFTAWPASLRFVAGVKGGRRQGPGFGAFL